MRLTIGITYHNEGELLTRCLQSFWSGEEKPDEVILYDDASTLRPESFIPSHIPVKVIRSEVNQGPAKGRNQILAQAQGDWIHFHDADDWVAPHWLETIAPRMSNHDLILTEVSSYADGQMLCPKVIGYQETESARDLLRFAIHSFILVPSIIARTKLLREMGGYRETLWQSEDWDFSVRLIAKKPRCWILTEPLSGIQIRRESRSQNQIETLSCVLQAILFLQRELPENYRRDLADKAAWAGTRLFNLREKKLAREAFQIAQALGPASFSDRKKFYRFLALRYGQETAERLAGTYHSVKQVLHLRSFRRIFTGLF